MRSHKRGEIYYADIDPVQGSEQGGRRPVLILQNNIGNKHGSTVIVAPITRKKNLNDGMPTHVWLGYVNWLNSNSVLLLEQIRTIDKSRLYRYKGRMAALKPYNKVCTGDAWWMDEVTGCTYAIYKTDTESDAVINGKIYQLMYQPRSYSGIVSVNNTTTYIFDEALRGLNITEFRMTGASLIKIGKYALADCKNLTYVDLQSSYTTSKLATIEEGAFENCISLNSWNAGANTGDGKIVIDRVSNMGKNVFKGCTSIVYGMWNSKNLSVVPEGTFENCTSMQYLTYGESLTTDGYPVKEFGKRCFAGCTNFTTQAGSLASFSGLEVIGEESFADCSNMSLLILPTSLKSVEKNALTGCTSLSVIAMSTATPLSLKDAGISADTWSKLGAYVPTGKKQAYLDAWSEEGVTAPGSIVDPSEKYRAISGNIYGCEDPTWTYYGYDNGQGYHLGLVFAGTTPANAAAGKVAIFSSGQYRTTEIGAGALEGNQEITQFIGCRTSSGAVTSTTYIEKIGDSAFKNCTNLTYAYFSPWNKTYTLDVGASAFEGCSSLASFELRSVTASIGSYAFAGTKAGEAGGALDGFVLDAEAMTNPNTCVLGEKIFGDAIPTDTTIRTDKEYTKYFVQIWGAQFQKEYGLTDEQLLTLFVGSTADMLPSNQQKAEVPVIITLPEIDENPADTVQGTGNGIAPGSTPAEDSNTTNDNASTGDDASTGDSGSTGDGDSTENSGSTENNGATGTDSNQGDTKPEEPATEQGSESEGQEGVSG